MLSSDRLYHVLLIAAGALAVQACLGLAALTLGGAFGVFG